MPDNKVISPNMADSDVELRDIDFAPNVDPVMKRVFSYLLGRNSDTGKFKFISVDSNGGLSITLATKANQTPTTSKTTITTTSAAIIASNPDRNDVILQNISSVPIYIGDSLVDTDDYLSINAGDSLTLSNFVGVLYAVVFSGTAELVIMEM